VRPVLHALLHNTHLRELRFSSYYLTDAFKREVSLPAARANTSLRVLVFSQSGGTVVCPEAQALVAARAAAELADEAR
jgi:hypothetical protein